MQNILAYTLFINVNRWPFLTTYRSGISVMISSDINSPRELLASFKF